MNTETLQASKWLQIQVLADIPEMVDLLDSMEEVRIYKVGALTAPGKERATVETFIQAYGEYITQLKMGTIPDVTHYRPRFSVALTLEDDHIFFIQTEDNKQLVRISKPVVQVQIHTMGYSVIEKKFRPKVLGKESIHWGLQFSYPQLISDPETKNIEKVFSNPKFPNTALFRTIQEWIKAETVPTPFLVDDKRINVPMRLGKSCFEWIDQHPQLKAYGIKVNK